ncbi:MAG: hypothetical protein M1475_00980 [Actinobacteria bacterium]|nr:hypothetical protein [Actinomycetota bacterium]MCL6086963.1 hypothetical protein [Actinomycetota bacterium]
MQNNSKVIKIFTMKQEFPCGPQAGCCGPIGQSEEELNSLKDDIEKDLNITVEIFDIKKAKILEQHPQIFELLQSFGLGAIPIITVGDEVACLGQSYDINEILFEIKRKL